MHNEQAQLIKLAREGDQEAFTTLLAQYSPLIEGQMTHLRSTVAPLSHEDEQDLRQEAYLAFYRAVLHYDSGQHEVRFGLYAKICIENALISAGRRMMKPTAESLDNRTLELLSGASGDDPTRHLREEEALHTLYGMIERTLSPYENAIWQRYVAGITAPEIAEQLGRDARSIHNAIYRIRRKLRAVISHESQAQ